MRKGVPAQRLYYPGIGFVPEGRTGSTFEGLWLCGVCEALKAIVTQPDGADADHIMVKRGRDGLDRARNVLLAAARSGSATSSSRASRRERARGIHACGGLLEAVRTRAGIRPAPEVRPVPSFCYTTVGKRNAEGDFTYRERFSSLGQDFSAEDTRRVKRCLCTLAHDLSA
ncbi:MAG: hypothetical protein NT005_08015, partial [Spirochaetes bacterium]|nr:hypothetical protein [Spirochaetota bacterium]